MSKIEEYRAKAADCRKLAAIVASAEARGSYEVMAQRWDKLATQFERHEAWMWQPICADHR
jgi:hypothetical protein